MMQQASVRFSWETRDYLQQKETKKRKKVKQSSEIDGRLKNECAAERTEGLGHSEVWVADQGRQRNGEVV